MDVGPVPVEVVVACASRNGVAPFNCQHRGCGRGYRWMMRIMGEERERRFVGVFAVVVVQGEAR